VSGISFVKWYLLHSTAAEHRGRTEKRPIKDHKVAYDYEKVVPVRLTVDKGGMLQESFIVFEVMQEYSAGGRGERITLGNVKLNLAEYVEQSDLTDGEEGVCRRYLMQDSKINSTLKVCLFWWSQSRLYWAKNHQDQHLHEANRGGQELHRVSDQSTIFHAECLSIFLGPL
jgi:hypothetical protein